MVMYQMKRYKNDLILFYRILYSAVCAQFTFIFRQKDMKKEEIFFLIDMKHWTCCKKMLQNYMLKILSTIWPRVLKIHLFHTSNVHLCLPFSCCGTLVISSHQFFQRGVFGRIRVGPNDWVWGWGGLDTYQWRSLHAQSWCHGGVSLKTNCHEAFHHIYPVLLVIRCYTTSGKYGARFSDYGSGIHNLTRLTVSPTLSWHLCWHCWSLCQICHFPSQSLGASALTVKQIWEGWAFGSWHT